MNALYSEVSDGAQSLKYYYTVKIFYRICTYIKVMILIICELCDETYSCVDLMVFVLFNNMRRYMRMYIIRLCLSLNITSGHTHVSV
jgi:hypothetical protein